MESNFDTWIDKIAILLPFPYTIDAILFGLSFFAICVLISLFFNFIYIYLTTFAVYLWFFGICFVFSSLKYAKEQLIVLLGNICKYFDESEKAKRIVNKHFKEIFSFSSTITWSIIITVLGEIFAFFSWYTIIVGKNSFLIPKVLPQVYYEQPFLNLKITLIMLMGIPVFFLLGTAAYQLIKVLFLWKNILKLSLKGNIFIITRRLHPIVNYHLRVVMTWFVGVALIALLAFRHFTASVIIMEVSLSILGLLFILVPLLYTRKAIINKKQNLLIKMEKILEEETLPYTEDNKTYDDLYKQDKVFAYYQQVYSLNPWLIDFQIIIQVLLGVSSSFIVTLIRTILNF